MMTDSQPYYVAYLHIRRFDNSEIVRSVGLTSLAEGHVKEVVAGITSKMDIDDYYVDDSEVTAEKAKDDTK